MHDKELRALVYRHIVQDVKRANKGRKNVALNKTLQNYMFTMLQDESEIAQKVRMYAGASARPSRALDRNRWM